jgi:hypothetical protein
MAKPRRQLHGDGIVAGDLQGFPTKGKSSRIPALSTEHVMSLALATSFVHLRVVTRDEVLIG